MEVASLLKQLASCSQSVRERTLRLILKTWLPAQRTVSDDELKKLWKALFYCVWHADKVSYQTHLINRLSSLLLSLDLPLSQNYFRVFLLTMRREWSGIDALRLDKFYLLIRRFFAALFELLSGHGWDSRVVAGFLDAVFCDGGSGFDGNGVNYHIVTVYLEELRRFLPVSRDVFEAVAARPFLGLMRSSSDKVLVRKVKSHMFDVLLQNGRELLDAKRSGVEVEPSCDVVIYGTIGLKMGFAARFFELGSSPECCQGNRKVLFGLHEDFSRLEKELSSSGIEVSMSNPFVGDYEEEALELIPINDCSGNVLESDSRKMSKKAKKNKKKKKKNKAGNSNEDVITSSAEISSSDHIFDGNLLFDDSMMVNLQQQFEKVAAEVEIEEASNLGDSPNVATICNGKNLKKRKRADKLVVTKNESADIGIACQSDGVDEPSDKSLGSSAKKVRFAMTNNLVWKPHTPLPPQSLRLPPTVTPRGSALKKGLSPGPIMETSTLTKKAKPRPRNRKVVRKKTAKSNLPTVKQLKKMNSRSL